VKPDLPSGLLWLGLGAFVTWEGWDLGLGASNDPGSGFVLFWAGLLMTVLAGVQLVRCVAGGGDGGGRIGDLWRGLAWWKPVAAVVVLAVYGAALLPLGFLVSTVVFLLVLMLAVDRNPPASRSPSRSGRRPRSSSSSTSGWASACRAASSTCERPRALDRPAARRLMDLLHSLSLGFQVALAPVNLLYCFGGVFVGTLIGVLPGIGPVAAMSLLLPATFAVPPESAIILMAGVYYGSMYGGSTTAILVNIPGEAASVVTCLDGYQMARQGRAGAALGIAAIGSFIAGTLAVVGLMLVAPTLARFAIKFGPAEYFSLMVLGLSILAYLSHGSMVKAVLMATFGLVLGLVGSTRSPPSRGSPSTAWNWSTGWASCRSSWACSASPRSWPTSSRS
jgi:hypothetical protein